jgi:hypothetical protein
MQYNKLTQQGIDKIFETSSIAQYPRYVGNGIYEVMKGCFTNRKGLDDIDREFSKTFTNLYNKYMNNEKRINRMENEYYTPTTEELLIAIINNEKIYTEDGYQLKFTYAESVENRLIKFLEMNDKLGNDYFINNKLYKLKQNN